MRIFSRIEAIPIHVPPAGVDIKWKTVGELLSNVGQNLGHNVGSLMGYYAIRQYVMGDSSTERVRSNEELSQKNIITHQGMLDEALRFTAILTLIK